MENIKKSRPPLRRSGLFNFGLIASSGQTVGDGILGVAVNEGGELVGGSDPAIVRPRVVQGFTSGVGFASPSPSSMSFLPLPPYHRMKRQTPEIAEQN